MYRETAGITNLSVGWDIILSQIFRPVAICIPKWRPCKSFSLSNFGVDSMLKAGSLTTNFI